MQHRLRVRDGTRFSQVVMRLEPDDPGGAGLQPCEKSRPWHTEPREGAMRPERANGGKRSTEMKPDRKYFGPVYPEAPRFKDPQDDLLEIGVTRVSSLRRIQLHRKNKSWREVKSRL